MEGEYANAPTQKGGEKMIDAQELHGRCEKFIAELDGSKTAFCARFKLSSNDCYAQRIDSYLTKFNF